MKSPLASKTIWGVLIAAGASFGLPAVAPDATVWELIFQIVGLLIAVIGRWGAMEGLTVAKPPAAVPLFIACLLASCAAPAASQGTSGQGGSNTSPTYTINVNIGTGGGVESTVTSAPAAAPSAASTATASQTATNDIKPDVTIPVTTPVPTIGGTPPQ